jgi:hypothetical protein
MGGALEWAATDKYLKESKRTERNETQVLEANLQFAAFSSIGYSYFICMK